MNNKSNYKYLLSDLTILKGIGVKTTNLLKKKILTIFLIYYGNYQNHLQIDLYHRKLKIYKLEKFKLLLYFLKNIFFLELEIYPIKFYVLMKLEKSIVFFLIATKAI